MVPLLTLVCSRSGGYAAHCKGFCVSSKLANWTKIASRFSLREKVRVHITMHEARHHNPWFNVSGLAFVSHISIHPCHLTGYDFHVSHQRVIFSDASFRHSTTDPLTFMHVVCWGGGGVILCLSFRWPPNEAKVKTSPRNISLIGLVCWVTDGSTTVRCTSIL